MTDKCNKKDGTFNKNYHSLNPTPMADLQKYISDSNLITKQPKKSGNADKGKK